MALFRPLVLQSERHWTQSARAIKAALQGLPLQRPSHGYFAFALGGAHRGFSSTPDPYKTLGLNRNATEAEIKKAYRDQALRWHPDKHSEDKRGEAQKRFSDATNAYEILKDPQKRQEYDLTGRVGGAGGAPGANGAHGGFQTGTLSKEDIERVFREAFGEQGAEGLLRQFLFEEPLSQHHHQGGQEHSRRQHGFGGLGGGGGRPAMPRQRGLLQADMEVRVCTDVGRIHQASRASRISKDYDERRARYAGKVGTIAKVDPSDQSIKLRIMVSPGRADEVWFGAGAVWDPEDLEPGTEVQIAPVVDVIHAASRESGIDTENDARRARCAGKQGIVVDIDHRDKSVKVRVLVMRGRADEVWFGMGAFTPVPRVRVQYQSTWVHPPEADTRGFSSPV